MSSIVSVSDLQKTYTDGLFRRKRVEALRGVSFDVQPGEIFGLLGPNGAGKTTLIKILLGIVKRSGGDAQVLGHAAGDRRGRRRIGYLPEHHRIPRHLTGYTALEYYGQLSDLPRSEIFDKRDAILKHVGLEGWGGHGVKGYSKGMQQRLGMAQAMLHDPELLILDEPTDGVDPVGRADIRETLFKLKEQGRTILINSHLLHEIELVCDRVAILVRGQVHFVGSMDDFIANTESNPVILVSGEESNVRSTVAPLEPVRVEPQRGGALAIELASREQQQIDQACDVVRNAGLSIVSISRQRQSLEQAFLRLLENSEDHGAPAVDNQPESSATQADPETATDATATAED